MQLSDLALKTLHWGLDSYTWSTTISLLRDTSGCRMKQSVANIFFGTEYEYEYIRNVLFSTNTNTNIFGIIFLTEYEYEYIRNTTVDRIRIFEYFWLEYSNIFGSNIWIFLIWIFEYYYRQTLKYSMEQIGLKICIPRRPRSQSWYYLC